MERLEFDHDLQLGMHLYNQDLPSEGEVHGLELYFRHKDESGGGGGRDHGVKGIGGVEGSKAIAKNVRDKHSSKAGTIGARALAARIKK